MTAIHHHRSPAVPIYHARSLQTVWEHWVAYPATEFGCQEESKMAVILRFSSVAELNL